ncbi:MAG: helix-turn-helix transcriptional regulator [Nocardioides sp.]
MSLAFRNVDLPDGGVETWPYEALVTAIERGTIGDWATLGRAIGAEPWGEVARQVEDWLEYADEPAVAGILRRRIDRARAERARVERDQVAAQVRESVARSGLSREEFARRIGTSRPRLSTYCSGKVTPSAALMLRIRGVPPAHSESDSETGR